jgi:hypothetical protein
MSFMHKYQICLLKLNKPNIKQNTVSLLGTHAVLN